MSNPYNQTSAYNFPPHNPQQPQQGQQGWGQPQNSWGQPQQKKKKNKVGIILLVIFLILALLVVAAEFGVRAYLRDQMTSSLKAQAASSGAAMETDPEVSFGSSPVLLGLLTSKIGHLDMTIPSTLNVEYPDGDRSKPQVTGAPEMKIQGRDMKIDPNNTDEMTFGELTMNVTMPPELMMAEASKAGDENRGGDNNPLADMLTITDVVPNPDEQVLEFQIAQGLATMKMKPVIKDGGMTFEVDGAKLLGFDLPQQFTDAIRDSLAGEQQSIGGNMEFRDVRVTRDGLEVEMYGRDVNMRDMAETVDEQGTTGGNGSAGGNGGNGTGSGNGGSLRPNENPNNNEGPIGSSEAMAHAA